MEKRRIRLLLLSLLRSAKASSAATASKPPGSPKPQSMHHGAAPLLWLEIDEPKGREDRKLERSIVGYLRDRRVVQSGKQFWLNAPRVRLPDVDGAVIKGVANHEDAGAVVLRVSPLTYLGQVGSGEGLEIKMQDHGVTG